jgi:hypothetical protein
LISSFYNQSQNPALAITSAKNSFAAWKILKRLNKFIGETGFAAAAKLTKSEEGRE